MKPNILFVDDESRVLEGLQRMLRAEQSRWNLYFAQDVTSALEMLRQKPFDAIVSDIKMPQQDGFALLEALRHDEATKDIPLIMLTGSHETDLKRRALDRGAADLLNKPIARDDLIARLQSMLRLKYYQDELKQQNERLERRVAQQTAELAASRLDIIWRLGKAAEYRDETTGNHIVRVSHHCRLIAQALGKDRKFIEMLFLASPLHDIGKIGIPDQILRKPGPLSPDEWDIMKTHCAIGAAILREDAKIAAAFPHWREEIGTAGVVQPSHNPILAMGAEIAMTHHEWWDGSGYPLGLKGEDIPLTSRIVALADTYDAICSERPYKPAFSEEEAMDIIRGEVGRHFDPAIYEAFRRSINGFRPIQAELADSRLVLAG